MEEEEDAMGRKTSFSSLESPVVAGAEQDNRIP